MNKETFERIFTQLSSIWEETLWFVQVKTNRHVRLPFALYVAAPWERRVAEPLRRLHARSVTFRIATQVALFVSFFVGLAFKAAGTLLGSAGMWGLVFTAMNEPFLHLSPLMLTGMMAGGLLMTGLGFVMLISSWKAMNAVTSRVLGTLLLSAIGAFFMYVSGFLIEDLYEPMKYVLGALGLGTFALGVSLPFLNRTAPTAH